MTWNTPAEIAMRRMDPYPSPNSFLGKMDTTRRDALLNGIQAFTGGDNALLQNSQNWFSANELNVLNAKRNVFKVKISPIVQKSTLSGQSIHVRRVPRRYGAWNGEDFINNTYCQSSNGSRSSFLNKGSKSLGESLLLTYFGNAHGPGFI